MSIQVESIVSGSLKEFPIAFAMKCQNSTGHRGFYASAKNRRERVVQPRLDSTTEAIVAFHVFLQLFLIPDDCVSFH